MRLGFIDRLIDRPHDFNHFFFSLLLFSSLLSVLLCFSSWAIDRRRRRRRRAGAHRTTISISTLDVASLSDVLRIQSEGHQPQVG